MEQRIYRNTSEKISLLGFGCMRLPLIEGSSSKIEKESAFAMIDYAIANGVNYFDTAYVYHGGESEPFLGEALAKYPRDSYNIATKMPIWKIREAEDLETTFNQQLANCKVDYFDYYLIHNISGPYYPQVIKFDIYNFLVKKKQQGKIRHLGFSFHDKPQLMQTVLDKYEWDFAQIQLNYMDWELQHANLLYEMLTNKGLPVVVMEPIRGGALATLNKEATSILKQANPNVSTASWALRYVASLPNVLTVLSGMSSMEQLKDNLATMAPFQPLTQDEYSVIAKTLMAYRKSSTIPCTACGYCMDCPFGVDIPRVFNIYNNYSINKNLDSFEMEYRILGKEKQAFNCTKCGKCLDLCPQSILIPEQMSMVKGLEAQIEE